MARISERAVYFILGLLLLFFAFNFQRDLGLLFLMGLLFAAFLLITDKQVKWVIERKPNRTKSLLLALGAYVVLLIGSLLVYQLFILLNIPVEGVQINSITSVVDVIAQTQQTLALEGNKIFNFIAFGFAVAAAETIIFHLRIFEVIDEFAVRSIRKPLNRFIAVALVIASLFLLFHITAKGIDANFALAIVFLFSLITSALIYIERQGLAAILFHVISNSVALALAFAWITQSGVIIFVVGTPLVLILILRQLKVTKIGG